VRRIFESDLELEAGEVGAEAAVGAGAEGKVAVGTAVEDDVGRSLE
jgi:hypothetical protein